MSEKARYSIAPDKCECDLFDFYENIAKLMNLKLTDKTRYDCRKICVTKPVQDMLRKYYRDTGYSNGEISMLLLIRGPKANLPGNKFMFEIEDGFIREAD